MKYVRAWADRLAALLAQKGGEIEEADRVLRASVARERQWLDSNMALRAELAQERERARLREIDCGNSEAIANDLEAEVSRLRAVMEANANMLEGHARAVGHPYCLAIAENLREAGKEGT